MRGWKLQGILKAIDLGKLPSAHFGFFSCAFAASVKDIHLILVPCPWIEMHTKRKVAIKYILLIIIV